MDLDDVVWALRNHREPSDIRRHELTNEEWRRVARHLPRRATRRGRPRPEREQQGGMLWILRTGAPWRDLPRERYGPWQTVMRTFHTWRRLGVLERVKQALLQDLEQAGRLDWDLWCVDGTSVRATRAAVGGSKGGG